MSALLDPTSFSERLQGRRQGPSLPGVSVEPAAEAYAWLAQRNKPQAEQQGQRQAVLATLLVCEDLDQFQRAPALAHALAARDLSLAQVLLDAGASPRFRVGYDPDTQELMPAGLAGGERVDFQGLLEHLFPEAAARHAQGERLVTSLSSEETATLAKRRLFVPSSRGPRMPR